MAIAAVAVTAYAAARYGQRTRRARRTDRGSSMGRPPDGTPRARTRSSIQIKQTPNHGYRRSTTSSRIFTDHH